MIVETYNINGHEIENTTCDDDKIDLFAYRYLKIRCDIGIVRCWFETTPTFNVCDVKYDIDGEGRMMRYKYVPGQLLNLQDRYFCKSIKCFSQDECNEFYKAMYLEQAY